MKNIVNLLSAYISSFKSWNENEISYIKGLNKNMRNLKNWEEDEIFKIKLKIKKG